MSRTLFERAWPQFETTEWSAVIEPGRRGARSALAELCHAYWQPTYCFIRARGFAPDEAEDLTQGLFASLLAPGALAGVDETRGRFRDWLRAAAKSFLSNEIKRAKALKRGGGHPRLIIDVDVAEETLRHETQEAFTPDRVFDRQWARTVATRARARLLEECVKGGKRDAFLRLESLLVDEAAEVTDAELSKLLGRTPNDLRVERHRLKQRLQALYREYIREEIGDTVSAPDAVDDEIRFLLHALT
jgi:DNA-directed RNA polymerase specialized sigma24 family protein